MNGCIAQAMSSSHVDKGSKKHLVEQPKKQVAHLAFGDVEDPQGPAAVLWDASPGMTSVCKMMGACPWT